MRFRPQLSPQLVVAAVFVAGLFMNIMDATVVNVAIPTLSREFHAGNASVDWVIVGYLLSLAIWIPASGWIGDRVGTKRTFLFALAVFTAGSVLCGLAQSLGQLVFFRVVQGVGGGMMTPVGTAMLFRTFPPQQRARASQILIIPTVIAPAVGPIVGGLFVQHLSWRWVFYVNVPIGVAAFLFGMLFLREHREPRAGGFDLPGFVLSGSGLALLLYAISEGSARGWSSRGILLAAAGGILAFTLLTRVELNRTEPMLDLRLLGDRLFRTANLVCLFAYASFLGLLFVMPLFLQEAGGYSPIKSGLSTAPEAIGVLVSTQLVGHLYGRVGPRRLMTGGLAALAALLVAMASFISLDTNPWLIRLAMFLVGAAMAYVIMPQQAATFATIRPEDTGRASAIYNTERQTAAALGVAILATVLSAASHGRAASIDAFRVVFVVDAALAAVGALIAMTIRDSDAAATMMPRLGPEGAETAAASP